MNILAVVPARGGSKGIPRKNLLDLAGRPLLAYTAEAALGSRFVNRAILSTDDTEIEQIGRSLGLEVPFARPPTLAADDTPTLPVIQHAVTTLKNREGYCPDAVVILQPTSPLRTSLHIDQAVELFIEAGADSLVSVVEVPHNLSPYSVMRLLPNGLVKPYRPIDESANRRQAKPVYYARNGAAIYIVNCSCLFDKNSLYGDKILPFIMSKETSIDIDDEYDRKVAELIIQSNSFS